MNNELQEIENTEVLKWNIPEDVTYIEEKGHDSEEHGKEISMLDQIFPPREWTQHYHDKNVTKTWRQTISRELPTRSEVSDMYNTLRERERFYNVKNKGICEIRSALNNLYFDEMLRQVTIFDEDVGALLYKIRNESKAYIFIIKLLLEEITGHNDICLNLTTDESELIKEIEDLTAENNILETNCVVASKNYALKKKQLSEGSKALVEMEKNHKLKMSHIRRSTKILREQLDIVLKPMELPTLPKL